MEILQCELASTIFICCSFFVAENACLLDRYKEKYGVSVDEGVNRLKGKYKLTLQGFQSQIDVFQGIFFFSFGKVRLEHSNQSYAI
jgi:hypothetical protein